MKKPMAKQRVENILELPTEMLHQILIFVPKRYSASLVCHRMYEAVCAVEFNKFIFKTDKNTVSFHLRCNDFCLIFFFN